MLLNLVHANLALILAVLSGYLIPAVAALVTSRPSGWTGLATTVLSAAAGFFGEWAASSDVYGYDWKTALQTAVSALVLAFVAHKVTWQGTDVVAKLHATGNGSVTAPEA